MSYDFEKLKEIGVAKIHKDTHISVSNLKSILNEDFEKISKVQFSGFISILEREYNLDLSDIKHSAFDYSTPSEKIVTSEEENFFVTTESKKKIPVVYIGLIVFVFVIAIIYSSVDFKAQKNVEYMEDDIVKEVQKNIIEAKKIEVKPIVTTKIVKEKVQVKEKVEKKIVQVKNEKIEQKKVKPFKIEQEKLLVTTFKIVPRSRVWMGFINLETYKKDQKTTSDEIVFDGKKEWLFLLGHGKVNVEINSKITSYHDRSNLRLHYKDGVITKVTKVEFKQLNNGRKW